MAPVRWSYARHRLSQRCGIPPHVRHIMNDFGLHSPASHTDDYVAHTDSLAVRSPDVEALSKDHAAFSSTSRAQMMPMPAFLGSDGQPMRVTPASIVLIALFGMLAIVSLVVVFWVGSERLRDLVHRARVLLQDKGLIKKGCTANTSIPKAPLKSILKRPTTSYVMPPPTSLHAKFSAEKTTTASAEALRMCSADQEQDISGLPILETPYSEPEVYVIRASESDHSIFHTSDSNLHRLLTQAAVQSIKRRAWADDSNTSSQSPFSDLRAFSPSTSDESSVSGTFFTTSSSQSSCTSVESVALSDVDSVASADICQVRRAQTQSMEVGRGVLMNWRLSTSPSSTMLTPGEVIPKKSFTPTLIVTGPSTDTLSTITTTSSSLDLVNFPIPPPTMSSALDGLIESISSSEERDKGPEGFSDVESGPESREALMKRCTVDQFIMMYGDV
ncbi:hypothetical protein BD626DRAFT_474757 [Schizophyllum amplum]|uniref:Uncharacterized protein n=1 Tax=Schizophyllum amplum TaxID=97359 RepID=A0A550CXT5_9AGAR|nr:hypothetical protein BD626DRAFT_474757 [Auriculariopsis ampla]